MKRILKNKNGFTLVELLAVIVILALIMAIAIVSMSGVIDSARLNTTKNNALYCIDAVRSNLILNNRLDEGTYYFASSLLEKGGTEFAFGGQYQYVNASDAPSGAAAIGSKIWRVTGNVTCDNSAPGAFVTVTADANGDYTYSICLPTNSEDDYYVSGTENEISNADTKESIVKIDDTTE